jgi:hypothetical protein
MNLEEIKQQAMAYATSQTRFVRSPEWIGLYQGYIEGFFASTRNIMPTTEQLLTLITSDWNEYGKTNAEIERYKDDWRDKLGYKFER